MNNTAEKKLDALIEALGFDVEKDIDYEEREISETEFEMINTPYWKGPYGIVVDGLGSFKRTEGGGYFKRLKEPEITIKLVKKLDLDKIGRTEIQKALSSGLL